MKTDYPELEGKVIDYDYGTSNIKAIVSGCNYHIGVTIERLDKSGYLLCHSGKMSPLYKNFKNPMPRNLYRKIFHETVKQIQKGRIEPLILLNTSNQRTSENPTINDCPYAQ